MPAPILQNKMLVFYLYISQVSFSIFGWIICHTRKTRFPFCLQYQSNICNKPKEWESMKMGSPNSKCSNVVRVLIGISSLVGTLYNIEEVQLKLLRSSVICHQQKNYFVLKTNTRDKRILMCYIFKRQICYQAWNRHTIICRSIFSLGSKSVIEDGLFLVIYSLCMYHAASKISIHP